MQKQCESICKYLENEKINYNEATAKAYSYHAQFDADSRLQECRMTLIPGEKSLRIEIVLPLRIKRSEMCFACREIALINEAIPAYAGYVVDPLDNAVKVILCAEPTDNPDGLKSQLKKALEIAQQGIDLIMDAISDARSAVEKREAKNADEEVDEFDEYMYEAETETGRKNVSVGARILNLFGLMEKDADVSD